MSEAKVCVTPRPVFLPLKSDASLKRFVFAYTITIQNNLTVAVTLKSRHWRIIDTNEAVQEVRGDGVVGETPTIDPGASYTYTSAAVIATETGLMEGSYQMLTEIGEQLEVPIPAFALIPPYALH